MTTNLDNEISRAQAAENNLQNEITHIQLTPGPPGPKGDTGAQGPKGDTGAQGQAGTGVTVQTEPAGPNCANGGVKLTSASGINYVCNGGSTTLTCSSGQTLCSGVCSSLSTDTNNCGGCGNVCSHNNINPSCTGSVCTGTCNAGFADCNNNKLADGCETNISTDTNNCGACGHACGTGMTCSSGVCATASCTNNSQCSSGKVCNTASGTCVDCVSNADCTNSALPMCDTTKNVCVQCLANSDCSLANANSVCNSGVCGIASCNTGFADCDANPTNGCETNIQNNPNNCGACGNVCPASTPNCVSGICEPLQTCTSDGVCQSGFFCDRGVFGGFIGYCVPPQPAGKPCSENANCISGSCDLTTDTCR